MVSVLVISYNQQQYIRQTLDSILMQQTSFDVQIIIADDASTDGTRAVCEEYERQYHGRITLLASSGNMGAIRNVARGLAACEGEFVALCEGDDYWTDPLKLQLQSDFLIANPSYSLCCTDYSVLTDESVEQPRFSFSSDRDISLDNWEDPYLLKTCTVLYRRKFFDAVLALKYPHFKDIYLFVVLLSRGKGRFLAANTAVYRIGQAGVWSSKSATYKTIANARTAFSLDRFFKGKDQRIKKFTVRYLEEAIALIRINAPGEKKLQREMLIKLFRCVKFQTSIHQNIDLIRQILRTFKA
jgi:glycosyltransferase involved in cell wall biosynthesis